jgi:hypothetical protein
VLWVIELAIQQVERPFEVRRGHVGKELDLWGGDRKSESFKDQTSSIGSLKSLGTTEKLSCSEFIPFSSNLQIGESDESKHRY